MKYVRTKDGTYGVYTDDLCQENEIDLSIAGFRTKYCRGLDKPVSKEDIVKVAETIEELCDEFVIVGTNWQQIIDLESAKYNCDKHDRLIIYGAIWTDKGLIYVAKMNEKGELELLL